MSEDKERAELEQEQIAAQADNFKEKLDAAARLINDGVPKVDVETPSLRSLVKSDIDAQKVFEAVESTIWRSFAEDIRRNPLGYRKPTLAEAKRRFRICEAWFCRARADLGYSLQQAVDTMGHALRCELDGHEFEPSAPGSRIWTPT